MKKLCIKFLLVLALFLVCSYHPSQCFAQDYIKTNPNKDYKTVIAKLKSDLVLNPNSYETYCLLGINYGLSGDGVNSQKILQEAIRKFPDRWNAYTFLADIERSQHMTSNAIDLYKKAMSLPSMPEDGRKYYSNLINTMIEEQKIYESHPSVNKLTKVNIRLNLNPQKWQQVYLKGISTQWILEYGLIGEDAINYKWTKLVTVNFFDAKTYNYTPENFCSKLIGLLQQQANRLNEKLSYTILSSNANNVYLKWSISNRNECEICRFYKHQNGLYVIHYAQKKNSFTPQEQAIAVDMLKNVQIVK